jgi:hypothetical protein
MRKNKFMLVALLCGFQAITVAQAAETWLPAGKAGNDALEMDASRFERQAESVTAWVRVKYGQPQTIPFSQTKFEVSERTYFFQCDKRLMVMAYNRMFDGVKVVYTYDSSVAGGFGGGKPLPQNVPESGIDRSAFDFACKYKTP